MLVLAYETHKRGTKAAILFLDLAKVSYAYASAL